MTRSSILGGESAAAQAAGRNVDALGPSDSSDSGSDVQGESAMPTEADNPGELGAVPVERGSDSDSMGTGERGAAAGDDARDGADILPDRIVDGPDDESDDSIDGAPGTDVEDLAGDDAEDDAYDPDAGEADPDEANPARPIQQASPRARRSA